ncbi:MAG TPA: phosphotransferase [Candidatus Merdenecus merdavium]|nr:phosphotransferase [Candidatus Merdenecus merdavium]
MNNYEKDILKIIESGFKNQRVLAKESGYSLGKVNESLKILKRDGYIDEDMQITPMGHKLLEEGKPKNAIILAAGYGMRMIPINSETPKGLIQVKGEYLIERMITQLHQKGIYDITLVVGFMKESYEYLIDKYSVDLKVNMDYAIKNNLHSLSLVADKIDHTYIIPCDVWCGENPFDQRELYSWYMVTDTIDEESTIRVNRHQELVKTAENGNQWIGIAYISGEDSKDLRNRLLEMDANKKHQDDFWEEALFKQGKMSVAAKVVSSENTYEINTYEQLRKLDEDSDALKTDTLELISDVLDVPLSEIVDITVLKRGMTNRSFLFTVKNKKYIMRVPGEETDELIHRDEEYKVYQKIKDLGLCDQIIYINPDNGYKITEYLENVRNCDASKEEDVKNCMKKLRQFHNMKLQIDHTFNIFEKIEFYETLRKGQPSCYRDYEKTKERVYELKEYIDSQPKDWVLTHMDAVPDNFLFVPCDNGSEEIKLIDWEYSGMQDPHVDIAMFAIYSLYNESEVNRLIDMYFPEGCHHNVRLKIYCYIAACGLLWSNWCEYKSLLGVEFGEYSLRQYRYAKDYYRIFKEQKHS